MQFFAYAKPETTSAHSLRHLLERVWPNIRVEWFPNLEHFRARLIGKVDKDTFAFVFTSSERELIELYFFEHLLAKVSLVLTLPDTECHTVALGHRLHPRFMCRPNPDSVSLLTLLRNIADGESISQSLLSFPNPFETAISEALPSPFSHSWVRPAA